MNWSFWKGVMVGAGGLLLVGMFMNAWGWLPWVILAGGTAYGYHLMNKKRQELPESTASTLEIDDEVDRRIEELRRHR